MKAYFSDIKDVYASCDICLNFKGLSARGNSKEQCIDLLKEAIAFDLWNNNRGQEAFEIVWEGGDEVDVVFSNANSVVYLGG